MTEMDQSGCDSASSALALVTHLAKSSSSSILSAMVAVVVVVFSSAAAVGRGGGGEESTDEERLFLAGRTWETSSRSESLSTSESPRAADRKGCLLDVEEAPPGRLKDVSIPSINGELLRAVARVLRPSAVGFGEKRSGLRRFECGE